MTKPTVPQFIAGLSLALCAYFARYEFETIKTQQREDRANILAANDKLQQLSTQIAVLIAITEHKSAPPRPPTP